MNITNKKMFKLITIFLFMGMLFAVPINIKSQETPEKTLEEKIKDRVLLEVSSVIGQPSSVLEFTIRNNSDQVIWAYNLNENSNFTIMRNTLDKILPRIENVNYGSRYMRKDNWNNNLMIKAFQAKSWRYNIADGLWFRSSDNRNPYREFSEEAGIYQLYWRVSAYVVYEKPEDKKTQSSFESMEYLAGPILLLKEQGMEGIDKVPHYEEAINEKTTNYKNVLQKDEVSKSSLLKIVHIANQPATLLEFTLMNDTKKDIKTTQILSNYNKIVIVKPNGDETECFTSVKEKDIKTLTIKPTEKQSWRIDLLQVGKDYGVSFDEPGTYKVYWKLINDKGETKEEINSEPVLFLKEAEKKPEDKQPPRDK
ncbi:MAG: hypothetical protein HZA49_05935 [Planctomycetes bacterium]|nr:hypothetical protein [Planctomycetota bacterium]